MMQKTLYIVLLIVSLVGAKELPKEEAYHDHLFDARGLVSIESQNLNRGIVLGSPDTPAYSLGLFARIGSLHSGFIATSFDNDQDIQRFWYVGLLGELLPFTFYDVGVTGIKYTENSTYDSEELYIGIISGNPIIKIKTRAYFDTQNSNELSYINGSLGIRLNAFVIYGEMARNINKRQIGTVGLAFHHPWFNIQCEYSEFQEDKGGAYLGNAILFKLIRLFRFGGIE
jgi:hypothetical protein